MAFVRMDRSVPTRMDLLVADTDGQNEKIVLTVDEPRQLATSFHGGGRFASAPSNRPAWSPDGQTIALSGINRQSVSAELIEVDAATGTERPVRAIEGSVPVFAHEFAYLSNTRLIASRVTVDETQQWWLHPHTGPPVELRTTPWTPVALAPTQPY